jgi:hypothetical protein
MDRQPPPYHIIGKHELLVAFHGVCAFCRKPVGLPEAWLAHGVAVSKGGQHTRDNIAPVHKACEEEWTRRDNTPDMP